MPLLATSLHGNWSLYKSDGSVAVPFDTFFSVDVSNEGKVTTYPMEQNGFFAYNKVQSPAQISVTLGLTGGNADRRSVVEALDELCASTELLSVVTPEKTYTDFTLESFDYTRTVADGIDRLKVNLRLVEIKKVSAEYSNETIPSAKNASDKKTEGAGKKAADGASAGEQAAVEKKQPRKSVAANLFG